MTIVISVGIIIYVAGSVGAIPQLFSRFVLEQNGAGFDSDAGGTTNITFFGLSTLVAAAPMWVAALILPGHPLLPNKVITIIAAVTGVAATLLAGRAAITVLLVIIPVVIWVAWRLITRGAPRRPWRNWTPLVAAVAAIGVVVILSALGNTSVERALNRVATVFTGQGQSLDDRIRSVEATKLLQAWTQSPIFGHGLGATIPGYSRSDTRPWNFELQYHLALFQFGLVGALVLVVAFAVAVYGVVRALRAQPGLLPAVLVAIGGAASMLIANGINPYLQEPGNMWPVYFVLMIINVVLAPALSARKGQE
ncbi:MAG: hypothetical protein H7288_25490 [Kineosporiaceae bacterium]|nr:hypothetical protein [Aeromicrobium sp.]